MKKEEQKEMEQQSCESKSPCFLLEVPQLP